MFPVRGGQVQYFGENLPQVRRVLAVFQGLCYEYYE